MPAEIPHANPICGRFNSWLLAKFEGGHTNRETGRMLEDAGFSAVEIESFTSEKMPPLIVPQIAGVATK